MPTNSFVVLGLAECFVRQDNELLPVQVVEPIASATLLTILDGIPTSYTLLIPSSLEEALAAFDQGQPVGFPHEARFADDFVERLNAATRTYQTHPEAAQQLKAALNLDNPAPQQRILNLTRAISDSDNIKQHPSSFST